ncbi:MAG TPA: hypothetical protein VHY09_15595 [Candidatus Methylacidiphilales bacterium]|jgi:hypothetical protein|nr:hypothetical protein [Candidatus Methylacidiphilales bacterium]
MAARFTCLMLSRAFAALALAFLPAVAQDLPSSSDSTTARELELWMQPANDAQAQAAPGESFKTVTATVAPDPFAVLTSGALWEETYGEMYARDLGDAFSLSCVSSETAFEEDESEMAHTEQMGLVFAPAPLVSVSGNFHGSSTDAEVPNEGTTTAGAGLAAESHLPGNSVMKVGLNFDHTMADMPDALATDTNTYNAEFDQPVGGMPLSAVLKGQFQDTTVGGTPAGSLPTLEQSLVWKPMTDTTIQMGLRQQQYQEFPGIDHELNEALFADFSQKVYDNVSWHSYAELLNTKGLYSDAPGVPLASGANGTPQATTPGSNASLSSSMPLSFEDQTVTLSTGPTVQLQKDISASLEYSNRWDKNPSAGSTGNEQRVSVSVKGTF